MATKKPKADHPQQDLVTLTGELGTDTESWVQPFKDFMAEREVFLVKDKNYHGLIDFNVAAKSDDEAIDPAVAEWNGNQAN